jgi:uncharacterized protein
MRLPHLAFVSAAALAGTMLSGSMSGSLALAQTMLPPAISVTGEATISVPPDLATIEGGVTSEAKTARDAAEANNKAMTAVLAAVKAAGIADKDIQTSRISLQPQSAQNRSPNGPVQIVGYRASNHVTVTLRDVTKVANVIDALVGAGANDIGGVNFSVSQASKLLDEARAKAMADALRKAEIYAKAGNVTLGAPLSISEGGTPGPMPVMYARKMSAGMDATPIAPGEETLHISVSVSYAIKQP